VIKEPEAQMCARCFSPLNPYVVLETRAVTAFLHPENADGWDHEPDPIPRDERVVQACDFCAQPCGLVVFRTRKTVIYRVGALTHDMGDYWAACERCAGHIRSKSPHLLIDRAVSLARNPDTGDYLNRPERRSMRAEFKRIHMAFFRAQPAEVRRGDEL
jgi:hypothetical protein